MAVKFIHAPKGSGKTTEIIRQYLLNPHGQAIVARNYAEAMRITKIINHSIRVPERIKLNIFCETERSLRAYRFHTVLFDDLEYNPSEDNGAFKNALEGNASIRIYTTPKFKRDKAMYQIIRRLKQAGFPFPNLETLEYLHRSLRKVSHTIEADDFFNAWYHDIVGNPKIELIHWTGNVPGVDQSSGELFTNVRYNRQKLLYEGRLYPQRIPQEDIAFIR